jgi:hypothetical protein
MTWIIGQQFERMKNLLRSRKRAPAYVCQHVAANDPRHWECTYLTRAGKDYTHDGHNLLPEKMFLDRGTMNP